MLQRGDGKAGAPVDHRRVDLVRPVTGDVHPRVAWEAEDAGTVLRRVDSDDVDRVGALADHRLTGPGVGAEREDEDRLVPGERGEVRDLVRVREAEDDRRGRLGPRHGAMRARARGECRSGDPRREAGECEDGHPFHG